MSARGVPTRSLPRCDWIGRAGGELSWCERPADFEVTLAWPRLSGPATRSTELACQRHLAVALDRAGSCGVVEAMTGLMRERDRRGEAYAAGPLWLTRRESCGGAAVQLTLL